MNILKTFFYSLKKSVSEPKYYKDIAKASFGFSFKYLLFLLFLLTAIKVFTLTGEYLKSRPGIQPEVNKLLIYAENFYPKDLVLKITNGQLSTNVSEPYFFDIDQRITADVRRHFLIIDTKGSVDNYPNYNASILATKNAVVYPSKSSNGTTTQTSVFYFSDLKQNFTINKKMYDNLINKIKPYTPRISVFVDFIVLSFLVLFLFFGSFFWTVGVMFGLIFLNFFVWLFNKIVKINYSYSDLYKMSMHAITLELIINQVNKFVRLPIPYSVVYFVWMLIVLFSLKNTQPISKSVSKK